MRLVAITRVLNEADIIEAFVRHHAAYVAHHILLDNGSIDGTLEILRALADEGFAITVLQTRAVSYCEQSHWSLLYDMAVRARRAEWVLCLDADEFVDDRMSPLPTVLGAVPAGEAVLAAPMVVYHATARDAAAEAIVPLRLRERVAVVRAQKVIVRGIADRPVVIEAGGHQVTIGGAAVTPWGENGGVRWAHYPERSPWQAVSKVVIGWCKALAAGQEAAEFNYSHHYGGMFQWLKNDPAHIFGNPDFMGFRHDDGSLTADPIAYRGGALRYTQPVDSRLRMVRVMADYFDQLATRHGVLLDQVPGARARTEQLNAEIRVLFGTASVRSAGSPC